MEKVTVEPFEVSWISDPAVNNSCAKSTSNNFGSDIKASLFPLALKLKLGYSFHRYFSQNEKNLEQNLSLRSSDFLGKFLELLHKKYLASNLR